MRHIKLKALIVTLAIGAALMLGVGMALADGPLPPSGAPTGPITITVTNGGTGYHQATTTVSIGAPPAGGVQATATVTVTAGVVTKITLATPGFGGFGYVTPPTVNIVDTDAAPGTGATATAAFSTHIYYNVAETRYSLHGSRLQSCVLCHTWDGSNPVTWALNTYGADVMDGLNGTLGDSIPAAAEMGNGKIYNSDGITVDTALKLVESKDSDGDNAVDPSHPYKTNSNELWALTFPGNASDYHEDVPSAVALGPHGGYGGTPDTCARCHRVHTAKAPFLLNQSQYALCMSCHDGLGGATTNVKDGRTDGLGLKGGGFVNTLMDTDLSAGGGASARPVSSTHTVDATAATMWGFGAISATPNTGKAGVKLQCGDCHNPHNPAWSPDGGTTVIYQYRMLQAAPTPAGTARGFALSIPGEAAGAAHVYSQDYAVGSSRPVTTYLNDRVGEFCALCHTRYMAGTIDTNSATSHDNAAGHKDSGDAVFTYRHATKEANCSTARCHAGDTFSRPRCVDCHVSHGTSAAMGTNSARVPWPGVTPTDVRTAMMLAADSGRSSLLRLDNRGVCTACHEK